VDAKSRQGASKAQARRKQGAGKAQARRKQGASQARQQAGRPTLPPTPILSSLLTMF